MKKGLLSIFIAFLIIACGDGNVIIQVDPEIQFEKDSIRIQNYLDRQGFLPEEIGNTTNGVRYVVLDSGSGNRIDESDFVEYNYIGKTLGDSIFDTSVQAVSDSLKAYYEENPFIVGDDTLNLFVRTGLEPLFLVYSSSGWTTPGGFISGWGEGMAASFRNVGENGKVLIVIPSARAYGSEGAGIFIPPNTPIAFELLPIKVTKQP